MQKPQGRNSGNSERGGFHRSGRGWFKKSGQRASGGARKSDAQTKYTKKKPIGAKTSGSYSKGSSSRHNGGGHGFGSGIGMMPI